MKWRQALSGPWIALLFFGNWAGYVCYRLVSLPVAERLHAAPGLVLPLVCLGLLALCMRWLASRGVSARRGTATKRDR
jgi:hypothetical protein